jgi:RNA polymerase II subunit A small phosphatase-like protein
MAGADFVLQIKVQNLPFTVYVKKRPGCEEFLEEMAKYYEVFIYTASLAEYADPVIDLLDLKKFVAVRLFRESCTIYNNVFVKDLSLLNRDLRDLIIVDNSEASFLFQPQNAVHIKSFFEDMQDLELYHLMPILALLSETHDVRDVAKCWKHFLAAEDEITILGRERKAQHYSKLILLEEFESIYPGKFSQLLPPGHVRTKKIESTKKIKNSPESKKPA